jgi:hypothetical protein
LTSFDVSNGTLPANPLVQAVKENYYSEGDRIRGEWFGRLAQEVGEDSPVASFVRIGQRRARYLAAESHVVELADSLQSQDAKARAPSQTEVWI